VGLCLKLSTLIFPLHRQTLPGLAGRFTHLQNAQCHFGIGNPKFTVHRAPHPKGMTLFALWPSLPVCSGFPHFLLRGAQKLQATDLTHSPDWESRASPGHDPVHVSHEMDPCIPLRCLDVYPKHTSLTQQASDSWRHLAHLGTANLNRINRRKRC